MTRKRENLWGKSRYKAVAKKIQVAGAWGPQWREGQRGGSHVLRITGPYKASGMCQKQEQLLAALSGGMT